MDNFCDGCIHKQDEGCLKNKQPSNLGCLSFKQKKRTYKKIKEKNAKHKKKRTELTIDGTSFGTYFLDCLTFILEFILEILDEVFDII